MGDGVEMTSVCSTNGQADPLADDDAVIDVMVCDQLVRCHRWQFRGMGGGTTGHDVKEVWNGTLKGGRTLEVT